MKWDESWTSPIFMFVLLIGGMSFSVRLVWLTAFVYASLIEPTMLLGDGYAQLRWVNFVKSRNPSVKPEYVDTYGLTSDFVSQLWKAVQRSPINNATGNHKMMFSIFDKRHLVLAKNLHCSSVSAGIPAGFHVFIALDVPSYRSFQEIEPSVMLYDVEARKFGYEQCCKTKLFIQYQLLLWSVESVICDDDLVFLRNPMGLFQTDVDFEFASECASPTFDSRYRYHEFNAGFVHVRPSEVSVLLYEQWILHTVPNHKLLDQEALQHMMKPLKISCRFELQTYQIEKLIGRPATVVFRYFHPCDVANGGILMLRWHDFRKELAARNWTQPYAVHLAWISQQQKIPALKRYGLFFLDGDICNKRKVVGFH